MKLDRKTQFLLLIIMAALLFGGGVKYGQHLAEANKPAELAFEQATDEPDRSEQQEQAALIAVHVTGAVAKPGLYYLPEGARVNDAVVMAEPLPEADLNALNLAAPLRDGEKVPVYKVGETVPQQRVSLQAGTSLQGGGSLAPFSPPGKQLVNINTAGVAELDTLPGIGPALAQRIIDYRTRNGPFKTVDELQNVSGIGDKKFADLKDLIAVN